MNDLSGIFLKVNDNETIVLEKGKYYADEETKQRAIALWNGRMRSIDNE